MTYPSEDDGHRCTFAELIRRITIEGSLLEAIFEVQVDGNRGCNGCAGKGDSQNRESHGYLRDGLIYLCVAFPVTALLRFKVGDSEV